MTTIAIKPEAPVRSLPVVRYNIHETNRGLCVLCRNQLTCEYQDLVPPPIRFCEEFEGLRDQIPVEPARTAPSAATSEPATDLKGLCVICTLRGTCTFPKPPGGVWHCEEYA